MRDFIIAICVLVTLVCCFSVPYGDESSKDSGMYLPSYTPTASPEQSGEAVPFMEGFQPAKPESNDKRPETSDPAETPKPDTPSKTIEELAWEVIIGRWDYTEERWRLLTESGYDAEAVQQRVDEILEQERRNCYGN